MLIEIPHPQTMQKIIIISLILLLLFISSEQATEVIYDNADMVEGSSPGGTECDHLSTYSLIGQSMGPLLMGFPISSLRGSTIVSAEFFLKPVKCVNADHLIFKLSVMSDPTTTFVEVNGIDNQCPFLNVKNPVNFFIDQKTCSMNGVDVTAALNAALAVNNNQLVLALADLNAPNSSNPNFCNPFLTPGETRFNNFSNCGVLADSREYSPSSFYIMVNTAEQTSVPGTEVPASTPASCRTTSVPSSTIANLAGNNNARESSGTAPIMWNICLMFAAIIAAMMV